MYVGIDVSTKALHAVRLNDSRRLDRCGVFSAETPFEDLVEFCAGASAIAIDSPDRPSVGAHAGDMIGKKFQQGRCAEVALGQQAGYWVPFTTPSEPERGSWIAIGISLFGALIAQGHSPIEVFPHAVFARLSYPDKLPKKTTASGLAKRVQLLRDQGIDVPGLEMWSHDSLDAAAAAVVASDPKKQEIVCGCSSFDGSALWLPYVAAAS